MGEKKAGEVKEGDKVVVEKGKAPEVRTATGDAKPGGAGFVDIPTDKGPITAKGDAPIKTED